jgi:hypothetical protein
MDPTDKKIAEKKIKQLVYMHGVYVKELTGLSIDFVKEYNRLYNEWTVGNITIDDIKNDIAEYSTMIGE